MITGRCIYLLFKKLSVALIVIASIILQPIQVFAAEVIIGGQSIGIELNYEGVMITGMYDIFIDGEKYNPQDDGYKIGDFVVQVNDKQINSISSLTQLLQENIENNQTIFVTLKRNTHFLKKELKLQKKNDNFSTGLYVQDSLKGIGTLTYYDPSTQSFGALGHVMNDIRVPKEFICQNGSIYYSYVNQIHPSKNGDPGEKIADIDTVSIGHIEENNNFGIFGKYQKLPTTYQMITTASMDEVEEGDAYFLTALNGNAPIQCHIRITHLKKQSAPDIKGITFEIVDSEVLSQTNGIIQGMSGSPIIQNGKLVGCVTHVNVNNVREGYGLYIDWMLENDKK